MEIYLHGSSDVKFYIGAFQKEKKKICKMSVLNHESPCHPLKRWDNVGKTAVTFPQIFRETLGSLVCLFAITKDDFNFVS